MRVRAERCTSLLRFARTLTPTPLSHGDYLRVAGGRGALRRYAQTLRISLNLKVGTLLPPGARGERTWMCAALRSEEGAGRRMRVRAERCTSLLRFARTLTPTPLPEGEGLCVATHRRCGYPSISKLEPFSLREKVPAGG